MPVGGLVALLALVGTATATHLGIDTEGHTTLEQILTATDPDADFKTLEPEQVDEDYVVRDPDGVAQPGRELRRRSLAYFSQLTDFQLADEESPARVEFLDEVAGQEGANLGLASLGGPDSVHDRRLDPADQPVRRPQPGAHRATAPATRWTSR